MKKKSFKNLNILYLLHFKLEIIFTIKKISLKFTSVWYTIQLPLMVYETAANSEVRIYQKKSRRGWILRITGKMSKWNG